MSIKIPETRNIISFSKLSSSSDDDEDETKEDKKSNLKLYLFFVCIFILLIIILISVILLVYHLIIKPDKSGRQKDPDLIVRYKERLKIQDYIDNCMNGKLIDKNKYPKSENPKISIIIPVYNKDKFILRLLRSIQNQSFKDIEIIICDDHSTDNSTTLVEELQKEDNRIILLKHEKNKGTLINRIDGAKMAKGEYILYVDADDLLIENILEKVYKIANETNIDIIHFQAYAGDYYRNFYLMTTDRTIEPIYQPNLSNLMYYEKGYLHQTEFIIWGKLIRNSVFKEVINSISEYYLNQHMSLHEDGLLLFLLFRKAKSYKFIKDFGLLYFSNINSTMMNIKKKERINKTVRDCFLYLEFTLEYTNNTLHEKNMAVHQFKGLYNGFKDIYFKITNGFNYIYKVINLYLNCSIILDEDKKEIIKIKKDFELREKNLTLSIK